MAKYDRRRRTQEPVGSSRVLGDTAPETGFAAMVGARALDEGIVSFERRIVLDARGERVTFKDVPCGMAVALGFGAL